MLSAMAYWAFILRRVGGPLWGVTTEAGFCCHGGDVCQFWSVYVGYLLYPSMGIVHSML